MGSWWPFKYTDDTSSFEKVLSQLSDKIGKASTSDDQLRQRQRRFKALWTLYAGFAYILVALILTLVTGWEKWGVAEYSAVAGGPVLVYVVRTTLDAYYNYRVSKSQATLNDLYKQREENIEKLKKATKYNSTQQLLDKYGGTPRKKQSSPSSQKGGKTEGGSSKQGTSQGGRTNFVPPPTANIPGRTPPKIPLPPEQIPTPAAGQDLRLHPRPTNPNTPGEEFAPNAFPAMMQPPLRRQPSAQYANEGPKWYDRILDVVLGEDETAAKNRIALICQECRLVNGLGPPGARSLEDVGRWRCSSCQAWNGVESEDKRIMKQLAAPTSELTSISPDTPVKGSAHFEDETHAVQDDDEEEEPETEMNGAQDENGADVGEMVEVPPAKSTRSAARQRRVAANGSQEDK